MLRQMGQIEQAQTILNQFHSSAAVGVFRLRHAPPPEAFAQALRLLQQSYPLLRASIGEHEGRLAFERVPDCPPIALSVVAGASQTAWRAEAERAVNTAVSHTAPLIHAHYLHLADDPTLVDLILVFHHAIMDAFCGLYFVQQLLQLAQSGNTAVLTAHECPPPSESLFPPEMQGARRGVALAGFLARQMGDEMRYRWTTRHGRVPPIHPQTECRLLTRTLSVADTRALTQATRRQGVTLNSAVAAAQLLVIHKHLYQQAPRPLRTMVFANLRPYLAPAVPPEQMGCYITPTRQTVPLTADPDFWAVAQHIQQNLAVAWRRGEGFLNSLMSKQLMRFFTQRQTDRLAATAVSYVGPITLPTQYGAMELTAVHAFLANNRLGPEFAAFVHLFQGALTWDMMYLSQDLAPDQAAHVADDICTLLQQIT